MPIGPMLAATFEEERTYKHLVQDGLIAVQPKIDCMRVLCDDGKARSRSWKLWTHRGLQAFVAHDPDGTHGWDGEMLPGIIEGTPNENIFNVAQSELTSAGGTTDLTYYLFDNYDPSWSCIPYWARFIGIYRDLYGKEAVPADMLFGTACEHSQEGRSVLKEGPGFRCLVKLCPTYIVHTMEEIYALEEQFLADGHEGAILRRLGRGYKWNRSTALEGSLTKLKRFVDFEAVIDGVYARQHNANEATTSALGRTVRSSHKANKIDMEELGGFNCHLLDNPEVTFNVGVLEGLGTDEKERLWRERETLLGLVITCSEQGYKGGYTKPRTPVFHRFRDRIELHD